MNIYNNNKQLLSTLGVEGNFSTDFEVRKAILTALGGDATECNTIYEVDTQILKIYEEGGGGSGSDVWDLSGKTYFGEMFKGCTNLIEAPKMITPDGTDFSYMFQDCTSLTTIPSYDVSSGKNFYLMFQNCKSLVSVPSLNTSSGTSFASMFANCINLESIQYLNTSNGTSFNRMFQACFKLTFIPTLDTSKGTTFNGMFDNCRQIETISLIDVSLATDSIVTLFNGCYNLKNITFTGSINSSIGFSNSELLTYDSVKSILTACSNTANTNSKTVYFDRTLTDQNGELAALVSTCTSKGWTISGLTLN